MYMKTYMSMHFWSFKIAKNVLFCSDAHHVINQIMILLTFLTIAHITRITHPTAVHDSHISVFWHPVSTFHHVFRQFAIFLWTLVSRLDHFACIFEHLAHISQLWFVYRHFTIEAALYLSNSCCTQSFLPLTFWANFENLFITHSDPLFILASMAGQSQRAS